MHRSGGYRVEIVSENVFESVEVIAVLGGRVASAERSEAVSDLAAGESLPGSRPRGALDGIYPMLSGK